MKRLMSITLAVVLVLALGSWALAKTVDFGTVGELEVEIPVQATIGPYAKVKVVRTIDFGTLEGLVGMYAVDHEKFAGIAQPKLGAPEDVAEIYPQGPNNGWGAFRVESNIDVEVALEFDGIEDGAWVWMNSPTLFGVHKGETGTPFWGDDPEHYLAWVYANPLQGDSFIHQYNWQPKDGENFGLQYDVNAAIWLQYISQQEAKAYTGKLVVTVSGLQEQ